MLLNEHDTQIILKRFQLPYIQKYRVDSIEDIERVFKIAHFQEAEVHSVVDLNKEKNPLPVVVCPSEEEIREKIQKILEKNEKALLMPIIAREAEFFLGFSPNDEKSAHLFQCSIAGRVVCKEEIPQRQSLYRYQLIRIMNRLQIEKSLQREFAAIIENSIHAYFSIEAASLQLSPLVLTQQKRFLVIKGAIFLDEATLPRQKEMAYIEKKIESTTLEQTAKKLGFSYQRMKGNIATLANGRALAFSVVDTLHFWGGAAANFLDIGEEPTVEKMKKGIELLLSQDKIDLIYLSLFFGSLDCETIIRELLEWLRVQWLKEKSIPQIVVQMEGLFCAKAQREVRSLLKKREEMCLRLFSSIDESARYATATAARKR